MKNKQILTFILFLFIGSVSFAQTNSSLTGNWDGSSVCQVKNSPCNSETVVYHISKGDKANSYKVAMRKIVDSKEEDMGIQLFTYDPAKLTLTCVDASHDARWTLSLKANKIKGTLLYKGSLYRVIELTKEE